SVLLAFPFLFCLLHPCLSSFPYSLQSPYLSALLLHLALPCLFLLYLGFCSSSPSDFYKQRWKSEPSSPFAPDSPQLKFRSSCPFGGSQLQLWCVSFDCFGPDELPSKLSYRRLLHPLRAWVELHAGPFAPAFSVAISFLLFSHRLRR